MAESVQEGNIQNEAKKEMEDSTSMGSLKEYEKLDVLLSKIPLKAQPKFLTTCDLVLTCIDADSWYIVLGSNIGLVFVFSREDNSIHRIKVTSPNNMITSVKMHQGTDHLMAVGTSVGHFNIYCFPTKTSTLLKEIKKFEVHDVHRHYITCLEWSANGMKLCSGDTKGRVALTEVDFYEDKCTSAVLLIDAGNEIVQLSYDHKILAVSTTQKSYVVRLDLSSQIINMECEDHMPGKFGACFIPGVCKTDDALMYVARPECFLLLSDMKGDVINTQTFSPSLSSTEVPEIVIHSMEKSKSATMDELQFGKLMIFRDKELVTWSSTAIVVLDPCSSKVVACQRKFDSIVDVAVVNDGEIFVLQRHPGARVIRIADKPKSKLRKTYNNVPEPVALKPLQHPLISKTEEKALDNGIFDNVSKTSLKFLKKSFAIPLKKLDLHIVNDNERTIPSATILSKPNPVVKVTSEPDVQTDQCDGKDEEREDPSQPQNGNKNGKEDQAVAEGSIIFSRKGKKQKKKHVKKGNHVEPVTEDKKTESQDVMEGEESTIEALKRADSLLERLNPSNRGNDNLCQVDFLVENASERHIETTEEGMLPSASEMCEERLDVHCDKSQSETPEEDVSKHISDSNTDLGEDDLNPKSITSVKSEASDKISASHIMIVEKDSGAEETCLASSALNSDKPLNATSPDTLNDCVEKALESLYFEAETNATDSDHDSEKEKEQVKYVNIDPLVIDPLQDSTSDLERVDVLGSPMEDLYAGSFFESGSSYSDDPTRLRPIYFKEGSSPTNLAYQLQNVSPKIHNNIWSELRTPTNIYSVGISDSHVWYTDKSENIYSLAVKEVNGATWKKASGKANQISVSPSGQIVWCLHKKVIHAGTKISVRHPEGLKWVEDVSHVDYISVDDNCAWYITEAGSIMVETNLSMEQPLSRPKKVACPYKLKIIVCRYGVVWGITERLQLLVRKGVTSECQEGTEWEIHSREEPPYMFAHVSIGHDQVGWAVDILGQIWFCTGVTMDNPLGCGRWWQVPLSESIVPDDSTRQVMKEVAQRFNPVKFSLIISTIRGGFVTVGPEGVFVALDFKNVFSVCKGSVQGYQWMDAQPVHPQLPSLSVWKLICASVAHILMGFVWAQHVNQDLYAFKLARGFAKMVDKSYDLTCISANTGTVWVSTSDGRIMAREGISDSCPEGTGWQMVNLAQIGDVHIVHLSCSSMYVWAVDSEGSIYHRIGARAVDPESLSPIWLQLDCYTDIVFTKIYTGPEEWMVWAIDNRRLIYTRQGVKDNMPIGKEWVHVTGIQAMDMTLSRTGAWALTVSGEIYYRQNITKDNVCGTHWKKIPGLFTRISASADDDLWGITVDGELLQCNIQHILKTENAEDSYNYPKVRSPSTPSREDFEWEFL